MIDKADADKDRSRRHRAMAKRKAKQGAQAAALAPGVEAAAPDEPVHQPDVTLIDDNEDEDEDNDVEVIENGDDEIEVLFDWGGAHD